MACGTPTDHPTKGAPQSHVHGMPCTLNPLCAPTIIRQRAPSNDARTTAPQIPSLRPDDHPMDGRAPQSYVHGMPCTLNPPCAARRMPRTPNPLCAPQSSDKGRHAMTPRTLNPPCAARRISAPTIIYGRNAHYSITPAEATRYHDSTRRYSRYRHRYDYVFGRYVVGRYPVLGAVPTLY